VGCLRTVRISAVADRTTANFADVQRLRWSDRPDLESWSANLASSDLGKSEFNTLLSSDLASAEKSRSSKSLESFTR
jgi:hypothetical protein